MNRQEFEEALAKGIRFFRCIRAIKGSGPVAEGELVELARDDNSTSPAFYFPNREKRDDGFSEAWNYMSLAYLEPYIEEKGVEKGMDRKEFEEALAKGIRTFVCSGLYFDDEEVIKPGEIVELKYDDKTTAPQFYYPNRERREYHSSDDWNYINLEDLTPTDEKGVVKGMNRQDFERAISRGITLFRCVHRYEKQEGGLIEVGELVELKYDDGSYDPAFFYPNKEQREYLSDDNWTYILLSHLEPYKPLNTQEYEAWADFVASEISCFHELAGHDEYVEQLCATILNIGEYLGGDYEKIAHNLELELRSYNEDICKREEALPEHDYKVGEILRVTYDYANWFNVGDIVRVTAIEDCGYIALESLMPIKVGDGKWSIPSQFVERV